MVDSSDVHADPEHPINVLLGFNPANERVKVMFRRWALHKLLINTCNVWSGIVMLKHSTVDVHVQKDAMLQDLVSISESLPTIMMNSCPHHDTATTKTVDLFTQFAA